MVVNHSILYGPNSLVVGRWSLGPGSVNFGACSGNSFDLSLTANFDANVASGCLRRNDISMDGARNKINSTSESVTHVSFFLR